MVITENATDRQKSTDPVAFKDFSTSSPTAICAVDEIRARYTAAVLAPHRQTQLSDRRMVACIAIVLFALAAWPLLLVDVPPLQDLPNHLATAHIIAHPNLYPEYVFNGFFKSNGLLTLWLHLFGRLGLYGAARAFTAVVLAVNAFAIAHFALHFVGRQRLPVAVLLAWPLVHSFSVSMAFLNFAFAFALSLILLTALDGQRKQPTLARGLGISALCGALWYAHPFPLAVVGALVAFEIARRDTWQARINMSMALLLPLVPAGLLSGLAAQQHLVKARHTTVSGAVFSYLNPWEIVLHFWTDVSGALTRWGSMTVVPAILLPYLAWPRLACPRRPDELPFLSGKAMAILAAAYVGLPVMLSNWWYLNCRLIPFLWAGLLLRVPDKLPRPVSMVLLSCALSFSIVTGIDYLRLDRDNREFTAGMGAVPDRATLLPLMFAQSKTSDFTASLTHAWGHYTVQRSVSAPLVFGVERSYPITYREFPPPALIPPALDRFAEQHATPAHLCRVIGVPADAACEALWRTAWGGFWNQATPRFSHVLTWAMSSEARAVIPKRYHRVFGAGELEIYAREGAASEVLP